jgi:hypothetical protein
LFHTDGRTDGQTDITKLTVTFSKFANAPKNSKKFRRFNKTLMKFTLKS